MPLHGLCVAARQDEGRPDAALGTDGAKDIIPSCIDQNPWAHLRRPMDMIFHG
jgi:hypothetical protein